MLRSYSFGSIYGKDEVPADIIRLFHESFKTGRRVDHASEIIFAGMQGRIDTSREFNMMAYESKIRNNDILTKAARGKKEAYIEFGSNDDDAYDSTMRDGGVMEDKITLQDATDVFEELCDSYEVQYAVGMLQEVADELTLVEGVDIIKSLKLALKGFPRALEEVRRICDFYPRIAENVKIVLSCGKPLEEIFA